MSADNGIYIAKFPDGFRVSYAQAIENITYFPEGSAERKEELRHYFGDSPLFTDRSSADAYAVNQSKNYDFLEYGIAYIGEYESFEDENQIAELREQLHQRTKDLFEKETTITKDKVSLVGKYFKLVQSYELSPTQKDSWVTYRKIKCIDAEGMLRVWEFEKTPFNTIQISFNELYYSLGDWVEISEIEFMNNWNWIVGEIVDFDA